MLSPRRAKFSDYGEDTVLSYLTASESTISARGSDDDLPLAAQLPPALSRSTSTLRSSASFVQNGIDKLRFLCMDLPYVAHGVDFDVTDDSFIPCDIIFKDLRGEFVPLSAALNRVTSYMGCYALTRGTTCPLPKDVSEMLSVVFHFPGYSSCLRQIASEDRGRPLSVSFVAFKIAIEMKTYMELARKSGKPLHHNGQDIYIDKLVLKRLSRVSKNVWQPEFQIWY
ncbi:hypothetical protein C8Q74DRAFT_1250570 [Fomes fomentarius]|nr:hypothetical protein C8Q74DRAFT_1250570 [Fomes fomentarius]